MSKAFGHVEATEKDKEMHRLWSRHAPKEHMQQVVGSEVVTCILVGVLDCETGIKITSYIMFLVFFFWSKTSL